MLRGIAIIFLLLSIPAVAFANSGYALQFDGIDDIVDMGDNYMLASVDYSIEFWILTNQNSFETIINKMSYGGIDGYSLELNRYPGKIDYYRASHTTQIWFASNSTINDGIWHHIAFVYIVNDGSMRFYIDGNLDASGSGPNDMGINNLPFTIGRIGVSFGGVIDELSIWNIPLSQNQISNGMHGRLQGNEAGLIGYWNFDEGQGDIAHDHSPQGINGRLGIQDGPDQSDPTWIISGAPLSRIWYVSVNGDDINGDGSQNNPLRNIQTAIYAANTADTVLVTPGIYQEHLNYFGKAIVVMSQAGADSTIIEKRFDGLSMVYFENNEDTTSIIDGFTIRNATATGINIYHSSPIIQNCIIENNVKLPSEDQGGGITIVGDNKPMILKNIIRNNAAPGGYGGGIRCHYPSLESNIRIEYNLIYDNSAGHGGGVAAYNCRFKLIGNLIFDNDAAIGSGVALSGNEYDTTLICGNSITQNHQSTDYGGIYINGSSNVIMLNNIVGFNDGYGIYQVSSTNIRLTYSSVFGNTDGELFGVFPGIGTIYVDPQFLDRAKNDFSLTANSPCIDVGDPASPYDPDGTRADMGALYFDQRYRILNFHLIAPQNDSIYSSSPSQFSWHSTLDIDSGYTAYYKFYLDDDPLFNSPDSSEQLSDTVYSYQGTINRSARYYWRVKAFNFHAAPIYSNETWTFYVDGFPSVPVILGPENGAQLDSLSYLSWIISTDPDSMDVVTYSIQIDDDPAFSTPEINQTGLHSGTMADDAFAIRLGELEGFRNLQLDTRYFWRVRADDNYSLHSDWTDGTNWFVFMAQNHPPNAPDSGFSPANGEEVISLTPLITWNDAFDPDGNSDSLRYAIRLSQDSTFAGFVYYDTTAQGINQFQPVVDLNDNSHYFYQIKTIDDGGLSSEWSVIQNFWTNHYNFPPEPFPIYGPSDSATQVVYYTHFSWGNTVDYDPMSSFTFALQYSIDSTFNNYVRTIPELVDTSLAIITDSLATMGQHLYWRIVAIDDDSLIRIGGMPTEETRFLNILLPGDANTNGSVNGIDVVFLVNYFKGSGPAPNPILAGDANGNCATNGIDVTFLVNYFKGYGRPPIRPDCEPVIMSHDDGSGFSR